eukprot:TRINITY_DN4533_c0_g1_i1.p1 TRINITY_DN4533_c0_g1~~TRINITY_DN4533_c0_g1_i1.p1  ORF type:complete len:168 (-),score=35.70 TRINITY_DN4533_c0_g1_i1:273-776(-)
MGACCATEDRAEIELKDAKRAEKDASKDEQARILEQAMKDDLIKKSENLTSGINAVYAKLAENNHDDEELITSKVQKDVDDLKSLFEELQTEVNDGKDSFMKGWSELKKVQLSLTRYQAMMTHVEEQKERKNSNLVEGKSYELDENSHSNKQSDRKPRQEKERKVLD